MKGTMTGNRAIFKIKGQTVGAAQNVSCSDDFGLQDIDELGNPESVELVVGKIGHTISGEKYFVNADTLRTLGIVPSSEQWLTAGDLEVEIIDTVTGTTLELYTGCKFASHSRNYTKHTVVGESFTIRSLHKAV